MEPSEEDGYYDDMGNWIPTEKEETPTMFLDADGRLVEVAKTFDSNQPEERALFFSGCV